MNCSAGVQLQLSNLGSNFIFCKQIINQPSNSKMHATFLAVVTLSLLTMSEIWSTAKTAPVIEKPDQDRVINLLWSANVSSLYPPRYTHYSGIQLCMHVHNCMQAHH